VIDEQRERESTRKAQIAIMPRQELNAHAYLLEQEQEEYETELAKLRSELDREREENQKLREELDQQRAQTEFFEGEANLRYEWYWEQNKQLQSAQQDRDKLIEGLQTIRTDTEDPYTSEFAKKTLKQIGVMVE